MAAEAEAAREARAKVNYDFKGHKNIFSLPAFLQFLSSYGLLCTEASRKSEKSVIHNLLYVIFPGHCSGGRAEGFQGLERGS